MPRKSMTSKSDHISEQLRRRIQRGEWGNHKLPSLRILAKEYEVSVVTVSRALQTLDKKGVVQRTTTAGYIPSPKQAHVGCWGICFGNGSPTATNFRSFPWDVTDGSAEVQFGKAFELRAAERRKDILAQLDDAQEKGILGVFFVPSESDMSSALQDEYFLQMCTKQRMPVVLLDHTLWGYPRRLKHDLVCVDHFHVGLCATEHLLEMGCRRICIIALSSTSDQDERVMGYLQALGKPFGGASGHWFRKEPLIWHPPEDLSPKEAELWAVRQIMEQRVDGIVCSDDCFGLGVMMELLRNGRRVPEDVAIVGYGGSPLADVFSLDLSTYVPPTATVLQHAIRVMKERIDSPLAPPVKVSVAGKLVVRQSSSRRKQ